MDGDVYVALGRSIAMMQARAAFITGRIDIEEFERRLDVLLGLVPAPV